jgi:predicted RNase H-like HicB family nuclease/DNA-binding XRE family transcriptional regulator
MRYPAIVTREGKYYLAEFPDLPGCQSFAESMEDLAREARDALTVRLRTDLADGEAPAPPSTRLRLPKGAKLLTVAVPAKLAVPLAIRRARQGADLSQAELARKLGVSQQQAAKLEQPDANPTIDTLAKVAEALGSELELALVDSGK